MLAPTVNFIQINSEGLKLVLFKIIFEFRRFQLKFDSK
jgi:hypothetical protein